MNSLTLTLEALILGLIGGCVPGPILTAVFTEVLSSGFKRSLLVVLKALIAESSIAVLVLSFFFLFAFPAEYFYALSLGGALVLFWLAWQVWGINKVVNDGKTVFTFWKLMLLTVLNGAFWIFWVTICVPRAFALREAISGGHILFLVLFELGWLTSTVGLGFVFSRFRPLLMKKKLVGTVFKFFAIVLVAFGVKAIVEGVQFFVI